METTERVVDDVVIVDVDVLRVRELVDRTYGLMQQGRKKLVLNLARLPYIDSLALGELVGAYAVAARRGSTLKLAQVPPRIRALLDLTKLATIFEIFDSERDAIRSFEAPGGAAPPIDG